MRMDVLAVLVGIGVLITLAFVLGHLRPLTADEVAGLATKRRGKAVRQYFAFHGGEVTVDPEFKKRMKPTGAFYMIDEPLDQFPSVAAALLKYKRHEWTILALEKEGRVVLAWLNKGVDASTVHLVLPSDQLAKLATSGACTSVLAFHNHPNPSPAHYSCTRPSETDLDHAVSLAELLRGEGVSFADFVCERGRHYIYHLSVADTLLPLSEFVVHVNQANNQSRLKNLRLHTERVLW